MGESLDDPDDINSYSCSFFQALFSSTQVFVFPFTNPSPLSHDVFENVNDIPSPEEIKSALYNLKPFKAVDIDGF